MLNLLKMAATAHEKRRCKEILADIDEFIPSRGYTDLVKEVFKRKGLEPPTNRRIYVTRQGKIYDLSIVKALQEISQLRNEDDELIEPPKWEVEPQGKIFETKPPAPKKAMSHRSRGKVKQKVG